MTEKLSQDMQGLANLIQYAEQYPEGVIKIGYYYYNVSSLMDALKDIKIRSSVGDINRSDKLFLEILCGLY